MSKNLSTKQLIRRERVSITSLVLSALLLFIVGVGIFVPVINMNNSANRTYSFMDKVVYNAANAAYGYGSEDKINPDSTNNIFVVLIDDDGLRWMTGRSDENEEKFVSLFRLNNFEGNRKNQVIQDWFYSTYNATEVQNICNRNKNLTPGSATPIDIRIAEEAMFYAGVDRSTEMASLNSVSITLIVSLAIAFVIMIPLIYLLSSRIIKPINDSFKHEKEFIGNASHELKTPLAIISAETSVLKEKYPADRDYFDQIITQCQNMNETVLDMIALSKLETTTEVLEKVDFSQLLLELCLSFDAVAFERGLTYSYEIDPNVILEKAYKKNLSRMVNLLIDNAMKYAEGKKIIKIRLKKEKHNSVLTFYNTGCQVENEDREKVFNRFYQGRTGSDDERKGSGLGLAIVKSICTKYNYLLSIDSQFLKYTQFTIVLE